MKVVARPDNSFYYAADDIAIADDEVVISAPPSTLLTPTWDGTQWAESATIAEQDAASETVRQRLMADVDSYAADKFFKALAADTISIQEKLYKFGAHLLKALEANDIINDRDLPANLNHPTKAKGGASKSHPLVEQEAAQRGVTKEVHADAIKSLADQQDGLYAAIEALRPVARDGIENYALTGSYAADTAAMQAIYDQFVLDLDAAVPT